MNKEKSGCLEQLKNKTQLNYLNYHLLMKGRGPARACYRDH